MIRIDVESMVEELKLTKDELDQVRQLVVKAYVNEVYSETVELAIDKLASSRGEYVGALKIIKVDDYTYDLELSGSKLALMIEDGCSSFDMKEGFERSPKAIRTKNGGWYLTIPMLFKTPSANPRSDVPGQIMPRKIYDLIRNAPSRQFETDEAEISVLENKDIPNRYQPGQLTGFTKALDAYIPKSSIYAGLRRTKDKETGFSNYNTFRRVSNNSDPRSWRHPGIPAFKLMDAATQTVDQLDIAETALQRFFPTSKVRVSVYNQLALQMNAAYNKMLGKMVEDIIEQVKNMPK